MLTAAAGVGVGVLPAPPESNAGATMAGVGVGFGVGFGVGVAVGSGMVPPVALGGAPSSPLTPARTAAHSAAQSSGHGAEWFSHVTPSASHSSAAW